jgi:hypothetical protein
VSRTLQGCVEWTFLILWRSFLGHFCNVVRSKLIQRSVSWLTALAVLVGLIGGSLPIVLCIGSNGHIALEPPHAFAKLDNADLAASNQSGCGSCVDFALHVSKQKEEGLYPALVASPRLDAPTTLVVPVGALWHAREYRIAVAPVVRSPPPLELQRTVVLLI